MTTMTSTARAVIGGVDTHADTHVAAACDHLGAVPGTDSFPTTATGYRALLNWLSSFGALDKIAALRRRIDAHLARGGQPILLEVDGGVKVGNIRAVAEAGADTFVAGSAIFGARDADGGYRGVIGAMREQMEPARRERAA